MPQNKKAKIKSKKQDKIPTFVVDISIILALIAISFIYISFYPALSIITVSDSYFQTLVIFAGIFIPLAFLIFIDLIKKPEWKEFDHDKAIASFILLLLLLGFF